MLLLINFCQVHAFSDDYVEPSKYPDRTWAWGLPGILSKNDIQDPRLVNCMPNVHPGTLCHPGTHRRMYWDSKDSTEIPPSWAEGLKAHHESLLQESHKLPKSRSVVPSNVSDFDFSFSLPRILNLIMNTTQFRFVPYCHHHDDCPNPSWRIMPLYVLENKVHSNLAIAPAAAKALDYMV
jgi:hypothetical protein